MLSVSESPGKTGVIALTDRQTNIQTDTAENNTTLAERGVNIKRNKANGTDRHIQTHLRSQTAATAAHISSTSSEPFYESKQISTVEKVNTRIKRRSV